MTERLTELRQRIVKESQHRGPHHHDIVTMALKEIGRKFGPAELTRAIEELRLKRIARSP